MARGEVRVVIVGVSQDGGVPQAGCGCHRCVMALEDPSKSLYPVSCLIEGCDGSLHLIEATRNLSQQLGIAAKSLAIGPTIAPSTVCLTHAHLGHIDGLGQFGKEVMDLSGVPLFASSSVVRFLENRGLSSPFKTNEVTQGVSFSPSEGCGFELEFIKVPHRDEFSDTHAIKVSGPSSSLLFLPDHDDLGQTLNMVGEGSIREWFDSLDVDYALLDGTFWSDGELGGRDMSQIPHPTISETLDRIGRKNEGDPEVVFLHLNHSNPAIERSSDEFGELSSLGWSVGEQGGIIVL